MLTRSKSCRLMQKPVGENLIVLTDHLMCIITQKLRSTHQTANNQSYGCCFQTSYLDKDLTLSEMQIAVINAMYFTANAIAVPESKSMVLFVETLKLYRYVNYFTVNSYRLQGFRFVKLPVGYRKRNHCLMFDDLAKQYKGWTIIPARDLSKCMLIWELESWLTDTSRNFSQPRASCWVLFEALQTGVFNNSLN